MFKELAAFLGAVSSEGWYYNGFLSRQPDGSSVVCLDCIGVVRSDHECKPQLELMYPALFVKLTDDTPTIMRRVNYELASLLEFWLLEDASAAVSGVLYPTARQIR